MTESTNPTTSLIEQAKQLREATEARVKALLKERNDIKSAHDKRQDEITAELKSLAWKPERKKRTVTKKAVA